MRRNAPNPKDGFRRRSRDRVGVGVWVCGCVCVRARPLCVSLVSRLVAHRSPARPPAAPPARRACVCEGDVCERGCVWCGCNAVLVWVRCMCRDVCVCVRVCVCVCVLCVCVVCVPDAAAARSLTRPPSPSTALCPSALLLSRPPSLRPYPPSPPTRVQTVGSFRTGGRPPRRRAPDWQPPPRHIASP